MMPVGFVLKVRDGFGFIAENGGPEVYFSPHALRGSLRFDELLQERPVRFHKRTAPDGRERAVEVWPLTRD